MFLTLIVKLILIHFPLTVDLKACHREGMSTVRR